MKFLFLLIAIICSSSVHSQESFSWDLRGLTPRYIVIEFSDKNKEDLYKHTLSYLKENPDNVIISTIEGDMIRVKTVDSDMFCFKILGLSDCYEGHCIISFEFKEGTVKIEPHELYYIEPSTEYSSGGKKNLKLNDASHMYNNKGKIRNTFKDTPASIATILNGVINSHKIYLNTTYPAKK